MNTIHYTEFINAPVATVWEVMLSDTTYRDWTSAFSPGSHFEGDWSEGSKILFIGEDPESGEVGGMVSRIKENRRHAFVSIEHLGIFVNGAEDYTSPEVKKWAPAYENYTFTEKDGGTELEIALDLDEAHQAMFDATYPKALARLKELAEGA